MLSRQVHVAYRQKQKENQADLLKRVNEETLRQLRHNQDEGDQAGSSGGRQISEVMAYRNISDMPSVRDLAIQVCIPTCNGVQTFRNYVWIHVMQQSGNMSMHTLTCWYTFGQVDRNECELHLIQGPSCAYIMHNFGLASTLAL